MKVIIDGREIDVPKGTSAIDAVFKAGQDVPYFCAHSYLSPVGACRMCLVEVGTPRKNREGQFELDENGEPKIFYFPKPMASCTTMASEGMHIKTAKSSEVVAKAQAGMMEFTLINHPLDCPTCDKGGACELQDRAFEYGYGASRYGFTRRHADKHYPLSDFIILDQERCIHCKRCVRYFEEVPNQEVLDFIERGGHTFIDTQEGELPTGFQGNIADICPVGALLDNVARFRGRNWEYDHTATTCTNCPTGCAITVDARNGRLERIVARENRDVNERWICDAGRFGHVYASEQRLKTPLIREAGQLRVASWDEAIEAIKEGLEDIDPSELGLYLSAESTLEEGVALEAFADLIGSKNVDHAPRYEYLPTVAPATLVDVATADAVVVMGADLGEESPATELRILEMLRGGIIPSEFDTHGTAIADLRLVERPQRDPSKLAFVGSKKVLDSRLAQHAATRLEVKEGSVMGYLLSGEHTEVKTILELLEKAERPVIILGSEVLNHIGGTMHSIFEERLAELLQQTGAKVISIPAAANGRGLSALNLVPREGGLNFAKLEQAKAAFISLLDPQTRAAGFTIVHETHLTATARRADVVLPALTGYEKRGTIANLEGRLLSLSPAALDSGDSSDLIHTLTALAQALGVRTKIRGLKSAQAFLNERLEVPVQEVPERGHLRAFEQPHHAPTDTMHVPQLWKERMHMKTWEQSWVDRIGSLVDNQWELPMHDPSANATNNTNNTHNTNNNDSNSFDHVGGND